MASQHPGALQGRLILIAQRRWVIAQQLSTAFKAQGASVVLARDAADAPDLAAAVLDGGCAELSRTLRDKGIPLILYTARADAECAGAPIVRKPARVKEVVEAVRRLLTPTAA